MKKQKLIYLALIGMSTGMLVAGCEKDNTRRDNRPGGNTAAAEQSSPVAINQSCGGAPGVPGTQAGCGAPPMPQGQGGYDYQGQGQRQYMNSQYQQGQQQGQGYQGYQGQGIQQQTDVYQH